MAPARCLLVDVMVLRKGLKTVGLSVRVIGSCIKRDNGAVWPLRTKRSQKHKKPAEDGHLSDGPNFTPNNRVSELALIKTALMDGGAGEPRFKGSRGIFAFGLDLLCAVCPAFLLLLRYLSMYARVRIHCCINPGLAETPLL